jgi:hypothetical protein
MGYIEGLIGLEMQLCFTLQTVNCFPDSASMVLSGVAGSRPSFCVDGSRRWLDLPFLSFRNEDRALHEPHQDTAP